MKLKPPESIDYSKKHPVARQIDETRRNLANEELMLSMPFLKHDKQRADRLKETLAELQAKLPENRIANKMADLRAQTRRPIKKLPDELHSSSEEKVA